MKIKLFKDLYNLLYMSKLLLFKLKNHAIGCSKVHFITYRKFSPNGGAGRKQI